MSDIQQLLAVGYDKLGDLLHLAGVDTANKIMPEVPQWAGNNAEFTTSWITTVLITGATLGAPIAVIAKRLKNMVVSNSEQVDFINGKNEELRIQIALVTKYFAVHETMVNDLQQLVTFALSLIDTLSDKTEAATIFAEVCEGRYAALQEKMQHEKLAYDQSIQLLSEQLSLKGRELEELKSQLDNERADHTEVISGLSVKYNSLKEEQEKLTISFKALQHKYDETSSLCDTSIKDRDEAIAEAEKWKGMYEQLKQDVAEKALDHKIVMLEQRLKQMRGKNVEYKAKEEAAKTQHKNLERKIASLEVQFFRARKEKESLYCKLKIHERDDKSWTDEIEEKNKSIEELKSKVSKMQEKYKADKKSAKEKQNLLEEDLRKQTIKYMQANDRGEKLTKRMADQKLAHKKEVKGLQNQLAKFGVVAKQPNAVVKPMVQVAPNCAPKPTNVLHSTLNVKAKIFQPTPVKAHIQ